MHLAVAAERGEAPIAAADIGRAHGISPSHVAKVGNALANKGFVTARRGRGGGLTLARCASSIRVGTVVRAFEPGEIAPCFGDAGACAITDACGLISALGTARDAFLRSLDAVTLADCVGARPPGATIDGLETLTSSPRGA